MTNSKIANFKVIAWTCFILFAIILIIVFTSNTMTKEQMINSVAFGLIATAVGIFLLIRTDRIEKKEKIDWWNGLSFEEQCQCMAADLRSGDRQWYLNPFIGEDDKYIVAILTKKEMNEFGHGKHLPATQEEIVKLHFKGKLKNPEMFNGVLTYL